MTKSLYDTRTPGERALGRMQRYVHSGTDPLRYRPWDHGRGFGRKNPAPMDFRRPKRLKPVKGGRWGVRKLAANTPDGWQWHAYNKGSLKALSARFPTQEQAVAYATDMANTKRMLHS